MDNLNRRAFLGRGGALLAALAALQANPAFLADALGAPPELGEAEIATYRALLEALGEVPHTKIDPSRADEAVEFLREWFGEQADESRRGIVAVLRTLEDGPDGAKFTKTHRRDRLKLMRGWEADRTPAERKFEARAGGTAKGHPRRTGQRSADERAFIEYVREQEREVERRAKEVKREYGDWILLPDLVTGLPPYHPEYDDAQPEDWPDESGHPVVKRRYVASAALALAGLAFYEPTEEDIETKRVAQPSF